MSESWKDCLNLTWQRLNWLAQLPFWLFAGYAPSFRIWQQYFTEEKCPR